MSNVLAFDVGTTSMKCILFSEKFDELYCENVEYSLNTRSNGIAELDCEIYFNAFCRCLSEMRNKSIDLEEIAAVCFTTQGETLIPVDKRGKPLCPAVIWLDVRAEKEAEFIKKHIPRKEMYSHTGLCDIDGALPAAKVLWLKKNKPDIFDSTYKFLLLEDYLIYRLTGKFVSEKSLQSSTGWYDIVNDGFYDKVFDICGIDDDKFPEVLPCGTIVGTILEKVAGNLGLSEKTAVVTGAMDQIASAIGAGNIKEGIVTETTGTALVLGATAGKPNFLLDTPVTIYKHYDDKFIYMPYSATAGIVLKWFRDVCAPFVKAEAQKRGISSYEIIDEMAENSHAGSNGVIMNPDFTNGGAFYGLTLASNTDDLARSVLEGVSFTLKGLIEQIENQGVSVKEIFSLGGGAYSTIWGKIKASVCNKKIKAVKYNQTTALGAAVLAAVAIGIYKDVESALLNVKTSGREFVPNEKDKEVYEKCYMKYKKYVENGGM